MPPPYDTRGVETTCACSTAVEPTQIGPRAIDRKRMDVARLRLGRGPLVLIFCVERGALPLPPPFGGTGQFAVTSPVIVSEEDSATPAFLPRVRRGFEVGRPSLIDRTQQRRRPGQQLGAPARRRGRPAVRRRSLRFAVVGPSATVRPAVRPNVGHLAHRV